MTVNRRGGIAAWLEALRAIIASEGGSERQQEWAATFLTVAPGRLV